MQALVHTADRGMRAGLTAALAIRGVCGDCRSAARESASFPTRRSTLPGSSRCSSRAAAERRALLPPRAPRRDLPSLRGRPMRRASVARDLGFRGYRQPPPAMSTILASLVAVDSAGREPGCCSTRREASSPAISPAGSAPPASTCVAPLSTPPKPAAALSTETVAALRNGVVRAAFFFFPPHRGVLCYPGARCRAWRSVSAGRGVCASARPSPPRSTCSPGGRSSSPARRARRRCLRRSTVSMRRGCNAPFEHRQDEMSEGRAPTTMRSLPQGDATLQHRIEPQHDPAPPGGWRRTGGRRRPGRKRRSEASHRSSALLVVVVIALVLAAPYWAPALLPLLPWGSVPSTASLEQRLAAGREPRRAGWRLPGRRLRRPTAPSRGLDQRIGTLEQRSAQPSAPPAMVDLAPTARRKLHGNRQALRAVEEPRRRSCGHDSSSVLPGDPAALQELRATTGDLGAALADLDARLGKIAASEAGRQPRGPSAAARSRAAAAGAARLGALHRRSRCRHGAGAGIGRRSPPLSPRWRRMQRAAFPASQSCKQRFRVARPAPSRMPETAPPAAADDWGNAMLAKLRGLVTRAAGRLGRRRLPGGPQARRGDRRGRARRRRSRRGRRAAGDR